jgi:hypothetical protein
MGYNPIIHWLDTLEESIDRVVEMRYDFKSGEIVADELPNEEPARESFDKQVYRYRIQSASGQEETREIEAEGDAQALRRVIVQNYPNIEVPTNVLQARDLLMTLRMSDVKPLLLWVRNMTNKRFIYDTEGRHYMSQSENKPEL